MVIKNSLKILLRKKEKFYHRSFLDVLGVYKFYVLELKLLWTMFQVLFHHSIFYRIYIYWVVLYILGIFEIEIVVDEMIIYFLWACDFYAFLYEYFPLIFSLFPTLFIKKFYDLIIRWIHFMLSLHFVIFIFYYFQIII